VECRTRPAGWQARVRKVEARLAVPAGTRQGRTAGYASPAERHGKTLRLKALRARLARVERRAGAGAVSVARGGRRLMRARLNLAGTGLTEGQWRERWEAARVFITADGEKGKAWGNETIRVNCDEGWLELKLPAPLAGLANRPHGRYRLACPPGQEPREREPHRPSGRDAASPGAIPETPGGQALTKETRRPTRPTAAARR